MTPFVFMPSYLMGMFDFAERANFPTDIYILEGLIKVRGDKHKLILVENPSDISSWGVNVDDIAVVLFTHVSYCTGRMLDMKQITSDVHRR